MLTVSPLDKRKTAILRSNFIQVITLNEALELFDNNISELSRKLKITRTTLRSYFDYGGTQLLEVIEGEPGQYTLKFINKNWTK